MKRLYYLLLALPLLVGFTACDDNDDVPPVDVTVTLNGAAVVDGIVYVVQPDGFSVESVNLINNGTKNAVLGSVVYIWDYRRVGESVIQPYAFDFNTSASQLGNHLFQVEAAVYAVDYSPCVALVTMPVKVVASVDDIPSGSEITDGLTLAATLTKN